MSLDSHLDSLRRKHRALDDEVAALESAPSPDSAQVAPLKKRKLRLKEEIERMERQGSVH